MKNQLRSAADDHPVVVDTDRISTIRTLRDSFMQLSSEIEQASKPILGNIGDMEMVFRKYLETCGIPETSVLDSYQRKKFLMVALYLYSPRTLAGGKMKSGLRNALARTLNVKTQTSISENSANLMGLYRGYRDFRRDVNLTLVAIYEELGIEVKK